MIEQCKGKDLHKVPVKQLEEMYYASYKYDGNYIQIHKLGAAVRFFTSGGKEFYIKHMAESLVQLNPGIDFVLEAEYIGETEGMFGDRDKATTTTFRTNFAKGLPSGETGKETAIIFDVIQYKSEKTEMARTCPFGARLSHLKMLKFGTSLGVAAQEFLELEACRYALAEIVNQGFEGIMIKSRNHTYRPGKRVNDSIKLKPRKKAILKCVGTLPEKDNKNLIGKLMLEDTEGRRVNAGSGLNAVDKVRPSEDFIGKDVGIEYERIKTTYIQPVVKWIKDSKD